MGSILEEKEYDVIIVGAGFSGLYLLDKFRKLGYSVALLEAGAKAGGIWYRIAVARFISSSEI